MVKVKVIGLKQENENKTFDKLFFFMHVKRDRQFLKEFFSKKFNRQDIEEIKICCKLFPENSKGKSKIYFAFPKLFKIKFSDGKEELVNFIEAIDIEPLIVIPEYGNCGFAMFVSTFRYLSFLLLFSETNI